mmetsp:Transcript_631/g.2283  ORF Transcript_631/g.2283 Transcript_631/m.2283 type:complete len:126 (+) Transcript_631:1141-1518(+)
MLTTRAYKERMAATAQSGGRGSEKETPTTAVVRVRFPDGLCLQGTFGALETVTALQTWVSEALREPHLAFSLYDHTRERLSDDSRRTLKAAGLVPSALVTFRSENNAASAPLLSEMFTAIATPLD